MKYVELVEIFKDNELVLRHVSFKLWSVYGVIKGIRMIRHRENQLWFEVLKVVRSEDEVEHKGDKGALKT